MGVRPAQYTMSFEFGGVMFFKKAKRLKELKQERKRRQERRTFDHLEARVTAAIVAETNGLERVRLINLRFKLQHNRRMAGV